jgi:hypothetical protein
VHTAAPEEHESVPVWQALPVGVQDAPFMQAPHVPSSQTFPLPQSMPLGRLLPVSSQTGAPVPQVIIPVWQALSAGVQAVPWMHGLHAPSSHTMPVPHGVPLGALPPVSVHEAPAEEQETVPAWHAFVGVQDAPASHAEPVSGPALSAASAT